MTPSGPFHLPVARSDSVSTAQVQHIYIGVKDHSLPKDQWTHGAHLCASVAIVSERGLARAETEMPDIIRSYNLACGVTNSDTEGYHQTLTLFYLRETARYLDQLTTPDWGQRTSALLNTDMAARDYPLRFYSQAHLFSVTSRRIWQPPDIRALTKRLS